MKYSMHYLFYSYHQFLSTVCFTFFLQFWSCAPFPCSEVCVTLVTLFSSSELCVTLVTPFSSSELCVTFVTPLSSSEVCYLGYSFLQYWIMCYLGYSFLQFWSMCYLGYSFLQFWSITQLEQLHLKLVGIALSLLKPLSIPDSAFFITFKNLSFKNYTIYKHIDLISTLTSGGTYSTWRYDSQSW